MKDRTVAGLAKLREALADPVIDFEDEALAHRSEVTGAPVTRKRRLTDLPTTPNRRDIND